MIDIKHIICLILGFKNIAFHINPTLTQHQIIENL